MSSDLLEDTAILTVKVELGVVGEALSIAPPDVVFSELSKVIYSEIAKYFVPADHSKSRIITKLNITCNNPDATLVELAIQEEEDNDTSEIVPEPSSKSLH